MRGPALQSPAAPSHRGIVPPAQQVDGLGVPYVKRKDGGENAEFRVARPRVRAVGEEELNDAWAAKEAGEVEGSPAAWCGGCGGGAETEEEPDRA